MITSQVDILAVPVLIGTILTNREVSNFDRVLVLRNLSATETPIITIQQSADGVTWANVLVPFTLALAEDLAFGDVHVEKITSGNMLRVRGSAGGNDRDLYVALIRVSVDTSHIWRSPVL